VKAGARVSLNQGAPETFPYAERYSLQQHKTNHLTKSVVSGEPFARGLDVLRERTMLLFVGWGADGRIDAGTPSWFDGRLALQGCSP